MHSLLIAALFALMLFAPCVAAQHGGSSEDAQ